MAENKVKKERTVIHLHLLKEDRHCYFGSIAKLCDYYGADVLGISYGSLRNYGLSPQKPYSNKLCVIRKGTLITMSGHRGENIKRLLSQ